MKTFALGLATGAVLVLCMASADTTEIVPEPTPTEVQQLTTSGDIVTPELDRGNYEVEVIPTPTPTPTIIPVYDTHENDPEPRPSKPWAGEPLPPTPEVNWHPMDEGVLICGPGAKPALDYNEHTGWGWWAYCEPALVD